MRGSVRVVSKRAGGVKPRDGELVIDVDRTDPVLGNPVFLRNHRDPNERARVIAAHGKLLEADVARGGPISLALENIARQVSAGRNIALRCWCAPRPCHADAYKKIIEERAAFFACESTDDEHR